MKPLELFIVAREVYMGRNPRISLTMKKFPKGFPRGEFLCENIGSKTYSFEADKILDFCFKHFKAEILPLIDINKAS